MRSFCEKLIVRLLQQEPPWLRLTILLFVISIAGCSQQPASEQSRGTSGSDQPAAATNIFRDITEESGLEYLNTVTPDREFSMPQIMGSGCGLADVNNDGRLDLLVCSTEPTIDSSGDSSTECHIFLQNSAGQFLKPGESQKIIVTGLAMGIAAADFDNDGDTDICITSSAGVRLFSNDGTGSFTDTTHTSGIVDFRWSTAAAFLDYDRDGWLDLLIVNYVDYFPGSICQDATGRRDYCGPHPFQGTVDRLYRNLGGDGKPGQFHDTTVTCGLATAIGKGLGAICSDFNGDGRVDIYIANDMEPNRLWIQTAEGKFEDQAELRGCAVDLQGRAQASMGTAWSDLDGDGRFDILLTHLRGETNTLYRQVATGVFMDTTAMSRIGQASLNFTGFGIAIPDLDRDGTPDLLIANGRVMRAPFLTPERATDHWQEYAERNQIFLNRGDSVFEEVTPGNDAFLEVSEVTRGLAVGDIDNDGRIDVVVNSTNSPLRIFQNVSADKGHWLSIRLYDPKLNRDAIGSRVRIVSAQRTWLLELQPHLGYLSTNDYRLHLGLGDVDRILRFEVVWPDHDSRMEIFPGSEVDRFLMLTRGNGRLAEHQKASRSQ